MIYKAMDQTVRQGIFFAIYLIATFLVTESQGFDKDFVMSHSASFNKTAHQNSTLAEYSAEKAVDGDNTTCSKTNKAENPWWEVDLGKTINVSTIEIQNSRKHPSIIYIYVIQASKDRLCGVKHILEGNETRLISCVPPISGSAVKIMTRGTEQFLPLCEVQVFDDTVTFGKGVIYEAWFNVSGARPRFDSLEAFLTSFIKPDNSDSRGIVSSFQSARNIADYYGVRMITYYIPPNRGNYIFYMSGDNWCMLYIKENGEQTSTQIGIIPENDSADTWTAFDEWDKSNAKTVFLLKDKVYQLTAVMKEGLGGDYLRVGVRLPSGHYERPMRHRIFTSAAAAIAATKNNSVKPSVDTRVRCQAETTGYTLTQGIFFWNSTYGNMSQLLECPYGNQPNSNSELKPRRYCRCDDEKCRKPFWDRPVTESCNYKTSKQLSDIYESLLNDKKTTENVSAELVELTINTTGFKSDDVNLITTILENIVNNTAVLNETGPNIVKSINNILNITANVIGESGRNNNSSKRILGVIKKYLENVPIARGRNVSQDEGNIAVHAQDFNVTSFEAVQVTDLMERRLHVVHDATTIVEPISSQVRLTMIIPKSFFESVKYEAKMQRLYFVVYRKTSLFQSSVQNSTHSNTDTVRKKNSFVIAASVKGQEINNLTEPIKSTYYPLQKGMEKSTECVFWDFKLKSGQGDWSGDGCNYRGSSNGLVTCHCNHLTNFAILMDVYIGDHNEDIHDKALSIISYIGCALSLFGLVLTIITILFFKDLRSKTPTRILLNFCIALSLTLVVFLAAAERSKTSSITGCRAAAIALHYFVLAAFMWMAIEAFNMFMAFVIVIPVHFSRFMLKCYVVGWGLPAIIVMITAFTSMDYYGDDHFCRLQGLPFLVAFLAPVLIILAGNAIAFVLIIRSLLASRSKVSTNQNVGGLQQAKRAAAILTVLGLTWLFGVLALKDAKIIFQYLFCIFNSIQGLLVFVLYCVLSKETRAKYRSRAKRFNSFKHRGSPSDDKFHEITLNKTRTTEVGNLEQ